MNGCILTTLRTYSLEHLLRAMFPVSVYSGVDFLTSVQLKYIIDKVNDELYEKSSGYYEAFLEQLEKTFADRMSDFSPYGRIPEVLSEGEAAGIKWVYAQAAIDEFYEVQVEELSLAEAGSSLSSANGNLGEALTPTNSDIFQPSPNEGVVSQPSSSPPTPNPVIEESSTQASTSVLEAGIPSSDSAILADQNPSSMFEVVDPVSGESLNPASTEEDCSASGINSPSVIPITPIRKRLSNRIAFLIEEQLYSLVEKLQGVISFKENLSLDESFLTKALPLLDMPQYAGEPRFMQATDPATVLNITLKAQAADYHDKFKQWNASREAIYEIFKKSNFPEHTSGAKELFLSDFQTSLNLSIPILSPDALDREPFHRTPSTSYSPGSEERPDAPTEDWKTSEYTSVSRFRTLFEAYVAKVQAAFSDAKERDEEGQDSLSAENNANLSSKADTEQYGYVEMGEARNFWDFSTTGNGSKHDLHRGVWKAIFDPEGDGNPVAGVRVIGPPRYEQFIKGVTPDTVEPNLSSPNSFSSSPALSFSPSDTEGKLFLERYIKTEKATANSWEDDFPGERYEQTSTVDVSQSKEKGITQILAPREVENTSEHVSIFPDSDPLLNPSLTSLGGEINLTGASQEVRNISKFESELLDDTTSDDIITEKYKKISFGLRLSYVAPLPRLRPSDLPPEPVILKSQEQENPEDWEFAFDPTVSVRSKSYNMSERYGKRFTTQAEIDNILSSIGGLENATGFASKRDANLSMNPDSWEPAQTPDLVFDTLTSNLEGTDHTSYERIVTVFPLFDVESDIPMPEGLKSKDFLNFLKVGMGFGNKSLEDLFNNQYMAALAKQMKESSPYKFLFDYCIPKDPIFSSISIYSNLINELPADFFSKTKQELKTLFETTLNGGDYTFEAESQKRTDGNRGAYARASANYGTEGKARDPSLFDFAIKTPKLIFKGLTEFIDPVIGPASKIVKAGAAGWFVPQTMKHLNPDGTIGGATDKNFFLTDVAFPPGFIPPPTGDIGGDEVTVLQSPNDGIVMFRYRDNLLKNSDIGNPYFDSYIQNVFMKYKPTLDQLIEYYKGGEDGIPVRELIPAEDSPQGPFLTEENIKFQLFAAATLKKSPLALTRIREQYKADLGKVRDGIKEELKQRSLLTEQLETELDIDEGNPFPPSLFKYLREATDTGSCDSYDLITGILMGEVVVDPGNFKGTATGYLKEVDIETDKVSLRLDSPIVDWIIWGTIDGTFYVSNGAVPAVIYPGYPLPLPITPIAMSSLPYDMVPYGPGPPHSPLGHIYHAVVAAEGLAGIDLDMKALLREEEGLESKKKLRGKLCIDMEQISAEERKRRGLE